MTFRILSLSLIILFFAACEKDGNNTTPAVTDIDGNIYKTIRIGDQIWMAENLKVTKLNDGTPIQNFNWYRGNDEWSNNSLTVPMYTWPDSSDPNSLYMEALPNDYYGLMYSEAAVSSGKLTPEGWRIPSLEDFKTLEDYLKTNGFSGEVGYALKSTRGWQISSNGSNGSNDVGFNALPNGLRHPNGRTVWAQMAACFTGSDISSLDGKRVMVDLSYDDELLIDFLDIGYGGAIRCIKDEE